MEIMYTILIALIVSIGISIPSILDSLIEVKTIKRSYLKYGFVLLLAEFLMIFLAVIWYDESLKDRVIVSVLCSGLTVFLIQSIYYSYRVFKKDQINYSDEDFSKDLSRSIENAKKINRRRK